jgi:hypothetical protein
MSFLYKKIIYFRGDAIIQTNELLNYYILSLTTLHINCNKLSSTNQTVKETCIIITVMTLSYTPLLHDDSKVHNNYNNTDRQDRHKYVYPFTNKDLSWWIGFLEKAMLRWTHVMYDLYFLAFVEHRFVGSKHYNSCNSYSLKFVCLRGLRVYVVLLNMEIDWIKSYTLKHSPSNCHNKCTTSGKGCVRSLGWLGFYTLYYAWWWWCGETYIYIYHFNL